MSSSGNASIKNTVIYKIRILNISRFKLVITVISDQPTNKQITRPIIAGIAQSMVPVKKEIIFVRKLLIPICFQEILSILSAVLTRIKHKIVIDKPVKK